MPEAPPARIGEVGSPSSRNEAKAASGANEVDNETEAAIIIHNPVPYPTPASGKLI